jgi:hypothetical protein
MNDDENRIDTLKRFMSLGELEEIDYEIVGEDCFVVEKTCFEPVDDEKKMYGLLYERLDSALFEKAYLLGQLKARDKRIAGLEYKIEQELNLIA